MLSYFQKKFNTNWFIFQNSLINANLDYLENLYKLIIEKLPNIKFEAQIYIRGDMKLELFQLLKKAGCYNLFVGLESGSDTMLKIMRKRFDAQTAVIFFRNCRIAGLHFEISLIVGHPGENKVTINETKQFIIKNADLIPKIAQINPFIRYEHSEINDNDMELSAVSPLNLQTEIADILDIASINKIRHTKAFVNNLM